MILFYDIDDFDFASFADENTPYSSLSDMISVLGQLKWGIDKIFDWFTSSKTPVGMDMFNITLMSGEEVKLLEIHIDNWLNQDYHISHLCKKTGKNCML